MCGVAGMAGVDADEGIVRRMSASIRHRGPDEEGCWSAPGISLGHQRLSIIDLSTGRQPIANEDGSIRIVYNGEVYNYRALRQELQRKGHRFATASDTEVIVHLYEEEGPLGFARLDGIFAFAIWDARHRSLVLARDPFGIKPLHYHFDGATLRFGSEIKAIFSDPAVPRRFNGQSVHDFLNVRFVPGEATLFDGIHRLPPGHYLMWRDGKIALARYWQLSQNEEEGTSAERWADGIRERLANAVERQLVSDVPLGLYLSGGLDSSALVAAAKPHLNGSLRTFTLGFNEPTDELDDARLVADHFHTEHHATTLDATPARASARRRLARRRAEGKRLAGLFSGSLRTTACHRRARRTGRRRAVRRL
jgi:asparagine synthase (glutamine-hydrolysing)